MKNEKTGPKAATLAGRILQQLADSQPDDVVTAGKSEVHAPSRADDNTVPICTVAELRTLAARCLTPAKDKKHK